MLGVGCRLGGLRARIPAGIGDGLSGIVSVNLRNVCLEKV